jgi:hypothetical protein
MDALRRGLRGYEQNARSPSEPHAMIEQRHTKSQFVNNPRHFKARGGFALLQEFKESTFPYGTEGLAGLHKLSKPPQKFLCSRIVVSACRAIAAQYPELCVEVDRRTVFECLP